MANAFSNTLNVNEWDSALYNAYKIMGCKDNLEDLDMGLVSAITEEGGKFQDKNQYLASTVLIAFSTADFIAVPKFEVVLLRGGR